MNIYIENLFCTDFLYVCETYMLIPILWYEYAILLYDGCYNNDAGNEDLATLFTQTYVPCLGLLLCRLNALDPGRRGDINSVISEHMVHITLMSTFKIACKIAVMWMLQNTYEDKSRLVQVIAWCLQTTNHCPSQYWPIYMAPLGHKGLNKEHHSPMICNINIVRGVFRKFDMK